MRVPRQSRGFTSIKLAQVLAELQEFQHDKKTMEVVLLSASGMPISAFDNPRLQKVHNLMHKLEELTGQTLEELFDKGGLQCIMENYNNQDDEMPF